MTINRKLTKNQQRVLEYCLANPDHGHVRISDALDITVEMARYRLKSLRIRGLVPPAKEYKRRPDVLQRYQEWKEKRNAKVRRK